MSMAVMTDVHEAAAIGDNDTLEEMVESGRDINVKDPEWDDRTPLHWAAYKGHGESVRLLLDSGAKPYMRTRTGWTAAHFAAELGRLSILRVLHSMNAPIDKKDQFGDTPLRLAEIYGHKECVTFLQNATQEVAEKNRQAIRKGLPVIEEDDEEWMATQKKKSKSQNSLDDERSLDSFRR
ncbi:ankyrin repeat domain-containing protein 66-like [Branchiostoma lanceolatum]|uniref:ankyrin repeat domain-containing protein 66-like n=1 Tax=Branchiostoma lanceolatum TaxID=7740 RepID=UPI0034572D87